MREFDQVDDELDELLDDELELGSGVGLELGRSLSVDFPVDGGMCRSCGCTEDNACPGGCIWATPAADLCSRCARER